MKKLEPSVLADLRRRFDEGQLLIDAAFELHLSKSTVSKYYEAFRREKNER